jgi:hypothetical protein
LIDPVVKSVRKQRSTTSIVSHIMLPDDINVTCSSYPTPRPIFRPASAFNVLRSLQPHADTHAHANDAIPPNKAMTPRCPNSAIPCIHPPERPCHPTQQCLPDLPRPRPKMQGSTSPPRAVATPKTQGSTSMPSAAAKLKRMATHPRPGP